MAATRPTEDEMIADYGGLIGPVELFDCDGGDWKLRSPERAESPLKPTERRTMEAGFDHHPFKPIDGDVLLGLLRSVKHDGESSVPGDKRG